MKKYYPGAEDLTPREREVIEALVRESSSPQRLVAAVLCISPRTLKIHIGHIYDKLGVCDRAQLIVAAVEKGLVASGAPTG